MIALASFIAGLATGWAVRGTTGSSRSAALAVIAAAMAAGSRINRIVAIERERFDDLIAEARARADFLRRGRQRDPGEAAPPNSHSRGQGNGAVA